MKKQSAQQQRATKRKLNKRKRDLRNNNQPHTNSTDQSELPHWDAVKEIVDLIRTNITITGNMAYYLDDPEIVARCNAVELSEGSVSIVKDLSDHIKPPLDKLTQDLTKVDGIVQDDQFESFINAFQIATILAERIEAVVQPQITALYAEINDAVQAIQTETGVTTYIPPKLQALVNEQETISE